MARDQGACPTGSIGWSSEWQPDLLHAHSPVLNALAALPVARRRGLPLVYEIRAFWEDAAVGNGTGPRGLGPLPADPLLETYAARRADAVAVICEGLRHDLIARGIDADKIIVSPNGVDMELFGSPLAADARLRRQPRPRPTPTRSASSAPSTIMRGSTI